MKNNHTSSTYNSGNCTGKIPASVSGTAICCAFLKEYALFFFIPILLIFLQLFILYISGSELKNTIYSTGLTLLLYVFFFSFAGIRFILRFRNFHNALIQAEQQASYYQDDELCENTCFTLVQITALQSFRNLKAQKTALQAENRQLLTEQNDYFALWIHQIKTPIAVLNLLLQNRDGSADMYFQMQKALLNIENYTQMVLHYLKLHEPVCNLYLSSFSLDTVIQTILRKYRSFFIYKDITLNYEPLKLIVNGESVLCGVMIEQIISNSLKYCSDTGRKGCITIRKGAGKALEQNIPVLIIEDNGTGIAASDMPKIFDKGYSGLNGKLTEKATGLGLYLAKEIADKMNCTLEIRSEYGKGTQAIISFAPSVPIFQD